MNELLALRDFSVSSGVTLLRNVGCLLTMDADPDRQDEATSPSRLGLQRDVDVIIEDGLICLIGHQAGLAFEGRTTNVIDGSGTVVMPALIDAQAAPFNASSPWVGRETVLRSQGLGAAEAQRMARKQAPALAGGIEPLDEVRTNLWQFARRCHGQGVGLSAAKSPGAVAWDRAVVSWQALCHEAAALDLPVHLAPSFSGLGPDLHMDGGLGALVDKALMGLPVLRAACKGAALPMLDIVVDRENFTPDQVDRFASSALQHGFDLVVHGDAECRSGAAELAARLAMRLEQDCRRSGLRRSRVLSLTNGTFSTESDLQKLGAAGVGVVVTPLVHMFGGHDQSKAKVKASIDAARLRASGVSVAIASGFDPVLNPAHSLWLAAFFALRECGFSMPEVLCGITCQAAHALGQEAQWGTIAPGRPARLIGFSGNCPEDFFSDPLGQHLKWICH